MKSRPIFLLQNILAKTSKTIFPKKKHVFVVFFTVFSRPLAERAENRRLGGTEFDGGAEHPIDQLQRPGSWTGRRSLWFGGLHGDFVSL